MSDAPQETWFTSSGDVTGPAFIMAVMGPWSLMTVAEAAKVKPRAMYSFSAGEVFGRFYLAPDQILTMHPANTGVVSGYRVGGPPGARSTFGGALDLGGTLDPAKQGT